MNITLSKSSEIEYRNVSNNTLPKYVTKQQLEIGTRISKLGLNARIDTAKLSTRFYGTEYSHSIYLDNHTTFEIAYNVRFKTFKVYETLHTSTKQHSKFSSQIEALEFALSN
jgi:hypothetical protein